MISIAVYNLAKTPLPFDLAAQVRAMQVFLDTHFTPIWDVKATLSVTAGPVAGSWGMVFLDNADQDGALAYHDEENNQPLAKVFVKTTLDAGGDVSVSASHELAEMLVDAACNRYVYRDDTESLVALEVADPVEDQHQAVNGFNMSNFVYPAWFQSDPFGMKPQFDWLGKLTAPFELSSKGYAVVCTKGDWQQIFGSTEKAEAFRAQDRRGRRGWIRVNK